MVIQNMTCSMFSRNLFSTDELEEMTHAYKAVLSSEIRHRVQCMSINIIGDN